MIIDPDQRFRRAELFMKAAKRAASSTTFKDLSPKMAYSTYEFAKMEELIKLILNHATTPIYLV